LKCSITECKGKAEQVVKIGLKETRNLCKYHYNLFNNKEEKHSPNFSKASEFKEKMNKI
jgi:hypothetical protein